MRSDSRAIPFLLLVLAGFSCAAKERISILDFGVSATARRAVNPDAIQDLTQQVRDAATNLADPERFEVMTRENILVMLPPGKKDLGECEGQCEVETARNLGSRWHVVGDVKKPGTRLVLSVRLYDVQGGTQLGGVRAEGATVDDLIAAATPKAGELFSRIPGLGKASGSSLSRDPPTASASSTGFSKRGRGALAGMAAIPGGCFSMGSYTGSQEELPAHRVCLGDFWMDTVEITNRVYAESGRKTHYDDGKCLVETQDARGVGNSPVESSFREPDKPVVCATWDEAEDFCASQGKRLPTEAEWEYASRAGSTTDWPWGRDSSRAGEYGWYAGNGGTATHPVGKKKPNAWGLHDMAGNVYEWTGDWYDSAWYRSSPMQDPTGPEKGGFRSIRGGRWSSSAGRLRSSHRWYFPSTWGGYYIGFRCVASSPRR